MSDNDKMREVWDAHDKARNKAWSEAWSEEPGTFDTLDAFKAGAAWQAAQAEKSVPVVGEVVGYLAGGTLMRRQIQGYECKPLIIRPKNSITTAELERLRKCADALKQMLWIVHDSSGVAGYHLNGDIAEWESFPEYHAALAAIAAEGEK